METEKRRRTTNFTKEECEHLLEFVIKHKNVIESKKCDAVTWQGKQKIWIEIALGLTVVTGICLLDAKGVIAKYDMLKKQVRSKCAQIRQNAMGNGGGLQKEIMLTSIEERIKGLILLSVEGLPSMYDSDSVPNCNLVLTEVAEIDVKEHQF
ncbi:uncharacterized protein [Onthophagus taurus]|uniref:uncharacterized protein n=1 Tax=Onthophagus taurus TaxID=166361 RepID=UPI0039BE1323